MTRFAASPTAAPRLFRAGLIGLYAAIAILGAGGLHAIAPHGQATCCSRPAETTSHSHSGCRHHSHPHADSDHSHPPTPSAPCQDEGCAICEITATAATPLAMVVLPPLVEPAEIIEPAAELHVAAIAASSFWSRGPPAVS